MDRDKIEREEDLKLIRQALDDAAYYRLGDDAANADEIEDDDDRDLFLAYRELLARI
jgi:hypothetical protein